MIEDIFALSRKFLRIYDRKYQRYFLNTEPFITRFSILTGQRGVGKTTACVQYLRKIYSDIITSENVLYIPCDHFALGSRSLYTLAEEFNQLGGSILCLDEIHKYKNWSKELKSIYDTFTDLKIIVSGSSCLEIEKGSYDLSRRALKYSMPGLSFREFLELSCQIVLNSFSLETIISDHEKIAEEIKEKIEKKNRKILALFKRYLQYGYYPYFQEYSDKEILWTILEQGMHTSIENDLIAVHPELTGNSIRKIKKLLAYIAATVPFIPDLRKLKTVVETGDERTLKTYLKYLEDGGLIHSISRAGKSLQSLLKPEKICLNNTNQIYALSEEGSRNKGNIRETFFVNIIKGAEISITSSPVGDFLVNESYTFEIGGKGKGFKQISNIPNSFLALDDCETGIKNRIPLWLFGFLY